MNTRLASLALVSAILACLGIAAASAAAVSLYFSLAPTVENVNAISARLEESSAMLLDCKANPRCLPSRIFSITGSLHHTLGLIAKATPEITEAAKRASVHSAEASLHAAGAAIATTGLVNELQGTARQATEDLKALHSLITNLDEHGSEAIRQAGAAAADVGQAAQSLDRLLAGEEIDAILKYSQETAERLAGAGLQMENSLTKLDEATGYVRDMLKPTKAPFWRGVLTSLLPTAIRPFIPQNVRVTNNVTLKE